MPEDSKLSHSMEMLFYGQKIGKPLWPSEDSNKKVGYVPENIMETWNTVYLLIYLVHLEERFYFSVLNSMNWYILFYKSFVFFSFSGKRPFIPK